MMKESLGLIETIGLTAGIEAADTAVKAANVKLVGYELTKGSGMTTVKLEGDVAAVKAAVEAGAMAASRVGRVVSTLVIPRPSSGLEGLIRNRDTVGYKKAEETVAKKETKKTVKERTRTNDKTSNWNGLPAPDSGHVFRIQPEIPQRFQGYVRYGRRRRRFFPD